MNCIIICDDDVMFTENLKKEIGGLLQERNRNFRIYSFDCAESISDQILSYCDVAFLDIDFKGKQYTGLDIARRLRKLREDAIIVFVTNYIEYAPAGYEVQAFRYVLKNELKDKLSTYLDQMLDRIQTVRKNLKINIKGEMVDIAINDILYIEAVDHLLNIYVKGNAKSTPQVYSCYSSLSKIEEELKPQGFLRVHKSYLVNISHTQKFNSSKAVLSNGTALRVSAKFYSERKREYLMWKGQR